MPACIHSFFLTADFVTIAVWNSHFGLNGLKIMWEQNMLGGIDAFDSSKPVQWMVVDRKDNKGLVAEFESPADFSFHSVNAWQGPRADGTVDIVCYDNLDILHALYYTNIRSQGDGALAFANEKGDSSRNHLVRFRLGGIDPTRTLVRDLKAAIRCAERIFKIPSPHSGELPTINPSYSTYPSRYVYGVVNRGYSFFLDSLFKTNTETRKTTN